MRVYHGNHIDAVEVVLRPTVWETHLKNILELLLQNYVLDPCYRHSIFYFSSFRRVVFSYIFDTVFVVVEEVHLITFFATYVAYMTHLAFI